MLSREFSCLRPQRQEKSVSLHSRIIPIGTNTNLPRGQYLQWKQEDISTNWQISQDFLQRGLLRNCHDDVRVAQISRRVDQMPSGPQFHHNPTLAKSYFCTRGDVMSAAALRFAVGNPL
jgi:hypothetical protein